ncbi:MAG: DUF3857 and transglutaminase domain-containing protein [Candidatus Stygibacter australis]|nr:DUF3857 and transglutaminase domain-containing protein [Candidatus Stygibacter australis]MDP8321047.1 DUF3857 and transglutaminase domain-containing protein [Candidatus Stygibacter australis]
MKRAIIMILIIVVSCILTGEEIGFEKAVDLLSAVSTEDYPNSGQIGINNKKIELDEKCRGTYLDETFTKVLNEKGRQNFSLWFFYNTMYDTVYVKTMQVIKQDGTIIEFEPYEILNETGNAFSKFSNIYSETGRILKGDLPDIEVGDIIRYESITTVHNTRIEDNFSDQISVENYYPVLKRYYKLSIPESIKLNIHHINSKEGYVDFSESLEAGKNIYEFNVSVAPEVLYEPSMENINEFGYYIMLTTMNSWESISKWYYSLVAPHLDINDAMENKVNELIEGCTSRQEKAEKIFYWVARKVRYLGVDKETYKPGYEPHDVSYTFSTLGGVCRDKAALLVAMLRIAGISSDPILISSGYKLNAAAPVMWFNHAVAVSYDESGEPELFYDPTNENTKELFPKYLEDYTYIIASEHGAELRIVPVSPAEDNNIEVMIDIVVDENNDADCSVIMNYTGLPDGYIRSSLMNMNPQKKQEIIEAIISRIHPFSNLIDYTISDPNNKDEYISLSFEFKVDNYISESDDLKFIRLEASRLALFPFYDYHLYAFNISERKYPFKLDNTYSLDIIETIKFPDEISEVSIPEINDLDKKGFNFTFKHEKPDSRSLSFKTNFSINEIHFEKEDFPDLKNEIANLATYEKLYIIIEN